MIPYVAPTVTFALDEKLIRQLDLDMQRLQRSLQNVEVALHSEVIVDDSQGNEYVLFNLLDKGTRAHLILPVKPNGVLVFEIEETGEIVFTRKVRHPGVSARHWLARIGREIAAGTFDAQRFFLEVMNELKIALIRRVPGRLKESFLTEIV
jgi:hypothetical protein